MKTLLALDNIIEEAKEKPLKSLGSLGSAVIATGLIDRAFGISGWYSEVYSGFAEIIPHFAAILISIWILIFPLLVVSLIGRYLLKLWKNNKKVEDNEH